MIKSISIRSLVILFVLALGLVSINTIAEMTVLQAKCSQRTKDCNDKKQKASMYCQTAYFTKHPDDFNRCIAAQSIAGQTCFDAAETCDDAADEAANN